MSKSNPTALTPEEIEEELVNNDLMTASGGENHTALQKMNLDEKKELLRAMKQSKEDFQNEAGSRSANQPNIDTSSTEFPTLSAAAKSGPRNKLKLPRRQSSGPKQADFEDSSDKCINLSDDDDDDLWSARKFSLPFCISDGAPPLPVPERPARRIRNPYFAMNNESADAALRRMLAHHDKWKAAYNTETRKLESRALVENIEDSDSKDESISSKSEKNEEKECDPYAYMSDSPIQVSKVYSGPKKRETNQTADHIPQNSRTLQRKTSRDSECEKIQPILKPEEPKLNDWITAARPRSKRNRKQISNQEKSKAYESSTEIEFGFERTLWRDGSSSPSSSSLNNQTQTRRSLPSAPEIEKKVQCPICQRNFTLSTVENHAATCEGFSSSPMDVEEEN